MDEKGLPQVGDCVEIKRHSLRFDGQVGRIVKIYDTRDFMEAHVRVDKGYLVRCKLKYLVERHPMACDDELSKEEFA